MTVRGNSPQILDTALRYDQSKRNYYLKDRRSSGGISRAGSVIVKLGEPISLDAD